MARSSGCPSSLTVAPALGFGVAGAVLAFVALCAVWLYQPPYRPTDEASHVAYARELSHGRLPTIDSLMSGDGDPRLARHLSSRDPVHRTIWTANHPPLYYALAAPASRHRLTDPARLVVEVGFFTAARVALAVTDRSALGAALTAAAVANAGLLRLLQLNQSIQP